MLSPTSKVRVARQRVALRKYLLIAAGGSQMFQPVFVLRNTLIVFGAGSLMLMGCGGGAEYDGPPRAAVHGTVSLDDQPVTGGLISFIPESPDGQRAGAAISGGEYSIREGQGPLPGKYRVEITWKHSAAAATITGPDGEDEGTDEDAELEAPPEEKIPPQYNSESTLTAELVAGDNERDFTLTSR